MSLEKDIKELVEAQVISTEIAHKIEHYYKSKTTDQPNRLFLVFAVLGALLVGLGIILIVAHNWDGLSRVNKTILSFFPLIIGQIACGYTLWKKMDSDAWREGSATFLFFAVGASISLISQVYNIPGNMNAFIISWMLLCLPLVYILKSSVVSLLYIIGITSYGASSGYNRYSEWPDYYYWPMLLLIIPHYYDLYRKNIGRNFLTIHHLFICISLMIVYPTITDGETPFVLTSYMAFFGCLYLMGHSKNYRPAWNLTNIFIVLGSIGTVCLLLGCSFSDLWHEVNFDKKSIFSQMQSIEFVVTLLLTIAASFLFYKNYNGKSIVDIKPIAPVYFIFLLIILLGFITPLSVILINLLVFTVGLMTVREGALKDHLGLLNYGLLIITSLITFRFFDGDIPFVWRGVMFLVLGIGFFLTNNWMLKRRKETTNNQP